MKKMLLFVAALLTAATSFAQDYEEENPTWTKTITNAVTEASDVEINSPIVITNQGDVIKTGTFTESFSFAGETFEPIAKSSYIVKYDKKGNEVWVNALRGAATVTAITADEEGNVFVAGKFADKVIITSTDGKTAEINGVEDLEEQEASFLIVYDKDGKLLANRAFVPSKDLALFMEALENEMYYESEASFIINKIALGKDKVYLTASYKGLNDIDGVSLNCKVLNYVGWMYVDLKGYAALQLDKDLTNAKILANVYTSESALFGDLQIVPEAMKLAVDGEDVYVAWMGWGDLTMSIGDKTQDFIFEQKLEVIDDEPTNTREHGLVVANITTGLTKVFHAPVEASQGTFFTIADMQVNDGKLYIAGTYIGALAFDNTLTSTGACDAFMTALNTSDLSVVWAQNSGIDEGEANKFNEMVIGMGVDEGGANAIVINSIDMGTKEIIESTIFGYEPEENKWVTIPLSFKATAISTSIAGSAINSNIGTSSTLRYFADDEFVQGIETIHNSQFTIDNGAIYNLQGQKVKKAQKGVYIQNGRKVILK